MTFDYLIQVFPLPNILSFEDDEIENSLISNVISPVNVS